MDKKQVLQAIELLARNGLVSEDELLAAHRSGATNPTASDVHALSASKVLYGIGGITVVAGIIFLLQQLWDSFGAGIQILVALGSSITLYVSALLIRSEERHASLSDLFFVLSAVLMPFGVFVTLYHLSLGGNPWTGQMVMAGVPALIYLISHLLFRRPILFFVTVLLATWTLYAAIGLIIDSSHVGYELASRMWAYLTLLVGVGYTLIGYAVKGGEDEKLVGPFYFLGSATALGAGFALTFLQDAWLIFYFLLILAAIYISIAWRSKSLLVFGSLALIAHLSHISWEYFANSLGWPLALIIAGFMIIGVGLGSVTIHRRFIA